MGLNVIDLPDVPERPGNDFDRAVNERLTSAQPAKLSIFTYQQLIALTPKTWNGYIVRCSNGNAGEECLAYCDGFNWKIIELGDNISLS